MNIFGGYIHFPRQGTQVLMLHVQHPSLSSPGQVRMLLGALAFTAEEFLTEFLQPLK